MGHKAKITRLEKMVKKSPNQPKFETPPGFIEYLKENGVPPGLDELIKGIISKYGL